MSASDFDIDHAVTRLTCLAANKRAARPVVRESDGVITATPFVLCRIDDVPEPSPKWDAADAALRSYADELHAVGGLDLMVEVYDEAAERHGYRSVMGVSASWDGCHGWYH